MSKFPPGIVPDANILVALFSKENLTFQSAEKAFEKYAENGWDFFAPNIIVAEVLYVLCQKLSQGILNQTEYKQAIEIFKNQMTAIATPENGDALLIKRAVEIQKSYGCSRTSDSLYIALAEELTQTRPTEILTFDRGFVNQAEKNAPLVKVNLLSI